MDEVYAKVGENEEERKLRPIVPSSWSIRERVVQLGVATHFGEEEGGCHDGNPWHSIHCLANFHLDLVLEKLRVLEGSLVKDKYV